MRRELISILVFCLAACGNSIKTTGEPDATEDPMEEDVAAEPPPEVGCRSNADCDDGDPCTNDICDTDTGECSNEVREADEDEDGYPSEECGGGTDCDDDDPEVNPGAEEVCLDGIDNDCDGEVDGPAVMPSDVQITDTDSASLSDQLSIVWAGSQYLMAWVDERDGNKEIYIARVGPDATLLGTDTRATTADGNSIDPALAFTGSEIGLVWSEDRDGSAEIYFARVAPDGTRPGGDIRITNVPGSSSVRPSVAWSGSEFGVSWTDDRATNLEIFFVRISPTGSRTGADLRITDEGAESDNSSIAWTGSEMCLAWQDGRDGNLEIYFARLGPTGSLVGSQVRVTDDVAISREPSLAWSGTEFGVVWNDYRDSNDEIYFARISAAGEKLGGDVRITDDPQSDREPFIASTGSEYGVVWAYWHGYSDCEFARISRAGEVLESYFLVPDGTSSSSYQPAIAWSGSEYGVGLMEYRDFEFNVFFNRIGFCE